MMQDVNGYYMGPPQGQLNGTQQWGAGPGSLPPVDTARLIPCRYFPDCRFGAACLFAHPQAPPAVGYYPGSPMSPQALYQGPGAPQYDPSYPPHAYYTMPPPSFISQPNGAPHMMSIPTSGSGPSTDTPSVPFSPNGVNHLSSYGASSPMSPTYNGTPVSQVPSPHAMFINGAPGPVRDVLHPQHMHSHLIIRL